MLSFIKRHPNYIFGFIVWVLSLVIVLIVPKLGIIGKTNNSDSPYTRFLATLSDDQKNKLHMFETGVLDIKGRYFYVGDNAIDEVELLKRNKISYRQLNPIIDEETRRLIIINSFLRTMPSEERDLVLARKAAIIYRNNEFIFISEKSGASE